MHGADGSAHGDGHEGGDQVHDGGDSCGSVPGDEHDGEDAAEHAHGVRCAKPVKVKKRVWGVKKSGLYGWKIKMVVVDQKTSDSIHTEKEYLQPTSNTKLKSKPKLIPQPGKQIVMTKEDNLARKVKMTSAEKEKLNKLLEDDPGTLSQDKNVDIDVSKINRSLSLCSSLEARLQDDRKTTLQSRVKDDQWKMAVKMTSMKTTPTEQLLGRGPGLNIHAEKLNSKNGPIEKMYY